MIAEARRLSGDQVKALTEDSPAGDFELVSIQLRSIAMANELEDEELNEELRRPDNSPAPEIEEPEEKPEVSNETFAGTQIGENGETGSEPKVDGPVIEEVQESGHRDSDPEDTRINMLHFKGQALTQRQINEVLELDLDGLIEYLDEMPEPDYVNTHRYDTVDAGIEATTKFDHFVWHATQPQQEQPKQQIVVHHVGFRNLWSAYTGPFVTIFLLIITFRVTEAYSFEWNPPKFNEGTFEVRAPIGNSWELLELPHWRAETLYKDETMQDGTTERGNYASVCRLGRTGKSVQRRSGRIRRIHTGNWQCATKRASHRL
ncbi:hypothetical protein HDE_06760 [Halotydeus destructor]|nr:hypothetical protein HDE_06760 [Halotydeus destructor]